MPLPKKIGSGAIGRMWHKKADLGKVEQYVLLLKKVHITSQ